MRSEPGLSSDKVKILVANHDRFLAFLRPRVGSDDVAEEILQAAFVKGIEKSGTIRDGETAVAWFYRLLRNAVIDHYRRRDAERRAQERYGDEPRETVAELDTALESAICACVGDLIPTLKAEYAEILRRVDLEGRSVTETAAALGLTPNNAGVRLHRAREALRKRLQQTCGTCTEHGCLECTCASSAR
jgi:RNA polymerase sigma-70 factor (ECF subfamily)